MEEGRKERGGDVGGEKKDGRKRGRRRRSFETDRLTLDKKWVPHRQRSLDYSEIPLPSGPE